jgi:hypothetical protein
MDSKGIVNIVNKEGTKSFGTGFYVSWGGKNRILTCHHVLSELGSSSIGDKVAFKFDSKNTLYSATLSIVDKEKDIALLESDISSNIHYSLSLNYTNGEKLDTIGFPGTIGIPATVTYYKLINGNKYIQLENANEIDCGFSGAPLINKNGSVIGVLTSIPNSNHNRGLNIAHAIPSRIILDTFPSIAHTKISNNSTGMGLEKEYLEKPIAKFTKTDITVPIWKDELRMLRNSINKNAQLLWIIGNQGCGKTIFSIDFIKKYYTGEKLIQISSLELNIDTVIERLHENLNTNIFFQYYGTGEWDNLPEEKRFEYCINAFIKDDYILLIDYIDEKQEALLSKILKGISSSSKLKVIVNTYGNYSNHFLQTTCICHKYYLPNLSFNDAKKVIQFYKRNYSETECSKVYNRFKKHLLAISTWAKTKDMDYNKMPVELNDFYKNLWERSSIEVKEMIAFLYKYENMSVSHYYDSQIIKKCIESGLLSRYESIEKGKKDIYIHNVVIENLESTINKEISSDSYVKITQDLYDKKKLNNRIIQMKEYLQSENFDAADSLLSEEGRLWVEIGQTTNVSNILSNPEYKLNTKIPYYLSYLNGTMSLFSGDYDRSMIEFKNINTANSFIQMAIKAEKMETYRRKGERELAINSLNDLYCNLQQINGDEVPADSVYWMGVSYFLLGQFFKEYREYKLAYRHYEKAKSYYDKDKDTVMCQVEKYHCYYAILSCPKNTHAVTESGNFLGSSFLHGLFNLRYSINLFQKNISKKESMKVLQTAKDSFGEINSPSYYTKCLAIELIYLVIEQNNNKIKRYLEKRDVSKSNNPKFSLLKQIVDMVINDNFEKNNINKIQKTIEQFAKKHYTKCILSCMGIIKLFEKELPIEVDLKRLVQKSKNKFIYEDYHIDFNDDAFSDNQLINTILLFD